MIKFLWVNESNSGFTEINNIGVVNAEDKDHAKQIVYEVFYIKDVDVYNIDELPFDWSYYT